mmetsp:Transcript_29183/g.43390  ORF Transcript_29183/g.43390 Transcript_29183/m.43390 type:complete len:87 (-) Transcript_29183:276-536(-)
MCMNTKTSRYAYHHFDIYSSYNFHRNKRLYRCNTISSFSGEPFDTSVDSSFMSKSTKLSTSISASTGALAMGREDDDSFELSKSTT